MPVLCRNRAIDRIKNENFTMLNNKKLEMRRMDIVLVTIGYTHVVFSRCIYALNSSRHNREKAD